MENKLIKGFILVVCKGLETYINVNHIVKIEPFISDNIIDKNKCYITLLSSVNRIVIDDSLSHVIDLIEEDNN